VDVPEPPAAATAATSAVCGTLGGADSGGTRADARAETAASSQPETRNNALALCPALRDTRDMHSR
jgi:hypothetical protein